LWWGFPLGNTLALAVTLVWFRNSQWRARTR
jgi:Na+-driven multidrug efflux pump